MIGRWAARRRSPLAQSYGRMTFLLTVLLAGGEVTAVLAATGAVSIDIFSAMPFASRELFVLLAVAGPFMFVYLALLATRNFEDLEASPDGVFFPVRTFREMLHNRRSRVPYEEIESIRYVERRGTTYFEFDLQPKPGRKARLLLPCAWTPDEEGFMASVSQRLAVNRAA